MYKRLNENEPLVLHIDGDIDFLNDCIYAYENLNMNVVAINVEENIQPMVINKLLWNYKPKIVVITGHDGVKQGHYPTNNLNDYTLSKYFVKSTQICRSIVKNYNELVIISGGCQSNYQALMYSGANFASSPTRTLISPTDPVYIAYIISKTPKNKLVTTETLYMNYKFIPGSIGGIPTRGQSIYL